MDDQNDLNKPADPEASVPDRAGQRRRGFLKLGAVPATLTLVSRPAQAWHCNSTSAWGSAAVNPSASVTARNLAHETGDECPSVSQWVKNNYGGACVWHQVAPNCTQASSYDKSVTLSTVLGKSNYSSWPSGLSGTSKLYDALQCASKPNGPYTFQQCLIVAMLNNQCYGAGAISSCVVTTSGGNQLAKMVGGTYTPPGSSKMWQQSDIMSYLDTNYIARTSP